MTLWSCPPRSRTVVCDCVRARTCTHDACALAATARYSPAAVTAKHVSVCCYGMVAGMENPTATFCTPALLAGDQSLTDVIAHEIAHSWTGNLVTNSTWQQFFLNEGAH